jgi:hypothetical protein
MSSLKASLSVDIDYETEDVVVSCSLGDCTTSLQFRVLIGWVVLYLLDPEGFDNEPLGAEFCERWLATDPPVGMMETNDFVLLDLPGGSLKIPSERQTELKTALAAKLVEFRDSIGPETM